MLSKALGSLQCSGEGRDERVDHFLVSKTVSTGAATLIYVFKSYLGPLAGARSASRELTAAGLGATCGLWRPVAWQRS